VAKLNETNFDDVGCENDNEINIKEKRRNKNSNGMNISSYLKQIDKIKQDKSEKTIFKNISESHGLDILSTEKFKLMNYLGNFAEQAEDLLTIDETAFNNMNHKLSKLYENNSERRIENPEFKISDNINIQVIHYNKPQLSFKEITNKTLEIGTGASYGIPCIEFDYLYNITKKLSLAEIKYNACEYLCLEPYEFILVNKNFHIWPLDICIYDEIYNLNTNKGLRNNSYFFQMDSAVTVKTFLK
jgi:hypothetical protein